MHSNPTISEQLYRDQLLEKIKIRGRRLAAKMEKIKGQRSSTQMEGIKGSRHWTMGTESRGRPLIRAPSPTDEANEPYVLKRGGVKNEIGIKNDIKIV